jgi:single-strand DNA-binding protein
MLGSGGDQMSGRQPEVGAEDSVNSVCLCGRVSSAPQERILPSGDLLLTFRVSVPRDPASSTKRSSDWADCVVWSGRVRRSAARWQVGDRVELEGALRRRFFRTATSTATRLEVEVLSGRRVDRAPTAPG